MVKYLLTLLLLSFNLNAEIIDTGNLLSNSGFTGGTSSWTNHGTTQQHHVGLGNECVGSAVDNSNSGCGVSGLPPQRKVEASIQTPHALASDDRLARRPIWNCMVSDLKIDELNAPKEKKEEKERWKGGTPSAAGYMGNSLVSRRWKGQTKVTKLKLLS